MNFYNKKNKTKNYVVVFFVTLILIVNKKSYAEYLPTDWSNSNKAAEGNSFTAWADSTSSVFFNPAGLSLLHNKYSKKSPRDENLPLPNQIEANELMLNYAQYQPNEWIQNMLDAAKDNTYKPAFISLEAFPNFVFGGKKTPTFLIGIPVRSENSIVFEDSSNVNNATLKSINTAGVAVALANSSAVGRFRWGISAIPNYRKVYYTTKYDYKKPLTSEDFVNLVIDDGIKTSAVNINVGFTTTVADFWFPTFGVSVNNFPTGCVENYIDPITFEKITMCGAVRTGGEDSSPNESRVDPTEVRVGVSLTPRGRIGKTVFNLRLSADAYPLPIQIGERHYGNTNVDQSNMVHVGAKLFFGNVFARSTIAFRGGYMNNQPTWGASLTLLLFDFSYSSYVQISHVQDNLKIIHTTPERRHMLNMTWQF